MNLLPQIEFASEILVVGQNSPGNVVERENERDAYRVRSGSAGKTAPSKE